MVEEAEASSSMSALAILSCRQSSHPFQERHIALHEPAKIGRSVARARPSPNNGIFDCKVLSRNHAMLWYENGTFYLQDTKSSNGTFINDQRLCKGGEESPPREVYSGDLIQFGVNVMENNRRGEKITHGCIIATITLYHPDGREAKPVPLKANLSLFNTPTPGITIQSQDLYKLAQYLQEALHREKMLEQKLSNLQQLVHNTQESSEGGWQALIDEDRLLSRLEVLENQLHAYSKNHTEDTLRQELLTLQETKLNYETTAKESLMKVLQEKIEAVTKLSDLERSLSISEEECAHLRETCEKTQEELQYLAEKYQEQLKSVQDIQIELQDAETKHLEEMEKVEKDKQVLSEKLDDMIKQETVLTAKVLALQTGNELSDEQKQVKEINEDDHLNNMKTVDSDQEKSVDSENEVISSVIIPVSVDKKEDKDSKDELPEDIEGKLKETQQQIEIYKNKLEESERQLEISASKVEELQKELETSRLESRQFLAKITSLEVQMSESNKQSSSTNDLISALQGQIRDLEEELSLYKLPQPEVAQDIVKMDTTLVYSGDDTVDASTLIPRHRRTLSDDIELEKLLSEAKTLLSKTEAELGQCRVDLGESQMLVKKKTEENSALMSDLSSYQSQLAENSVLILSLQEQIATSENSAKELQQQILEITGSLEEERIKHKGTKENLGTIEAALEVEKTKHKDAIKSLEDTKKTLSESQQTAKQAQNEATQLRNKLRHPVEADVELSRVRDRRSMPDRRGIPHLKYPYHSPDTPSRLPVSKRQANEFTAVKEECASLRKRIQAIESEMKMSRRENLQLSAEYNKLQESYKQLEALKDQLQDKESLWMSNLTDSQKETESSKQEVRKSLDPQDLSAILYYNQLQKAKEEIASLKKKCDECDHEINRLKGELKRLSGDYGHIAKRSKVISFVSCIPLLMLLFAILLALYPTLETFTANAT